MLYAYKNIQQGCVQKFCKGRATLGYLKKRGGKAQLQAASGVALEDIVKKLVRYF